VQIRSLKNPYGGGHHYGRALNGITKGPPTLVLTVTGPGKSNGTVENFWETLPLEPRLCKALPRKAGSDRRERYGEEGTALHRERFRTERSPKDCNHLKIDISNTVQRPGENEEPRKEASHGAFKTPELKNMTRAGTGPVGWGGACALGGEKKTEDAHLSAVCKRTR